LIALKKIFSSIEKLSKSRKKREEANSPSREPVMVRWDVKGIGV